MPLAGRAPALRRRLACFVYEAVLLFGVLMTAGWAFTVATGQRHALQYQTALQAFLFVVLALYFAGFWSHGGQTVAMKTWRIRVERRDGAALGVGRALLRYVAAWLWFVPGLLAARLAGLDRVGPIVALVAAGVLGYALSSRLHPQRQYWHDALCGTRLVDAEPAAARGSVTVEAHNRPR